MDGVIATPKTVINGQWAPTPENVEALRWLVDKSGAGLVISSSWRRVTLEDTISMFKEIEFPLADRIIGQTPRFYIKAHGDSSRLPSCPRGVEIRNWLSDAHDTYRDAHKVRYVILDDDNDMLLHQAPHFVQAHWADGLTPQKASKALTILRRTVPKYL